MMIIGRSLRKPDVPMRKSEWLPSGLERYDEGAEDLVPEQVLEWHIRYFMRQRVVLWTHYSRIDGDLADTHEKLLWLMKDEEKLPLLKEAERAGNERLITEDELAELSEFLEDLAVDECFHDDWEYLHSHYGDCYWRGRFYPEVPRDELLAEWKEVHGVPRKRQPAGDRQRRLKEDVGEFLNCYQLDAVCAGVPFVDICEVSCKYDAHDMRAEMVSLRVNAWTPVRELREVVEAAFGRFTSGQRWVDRGRARGERSVLMERNEGMWLRFLELREGGHAVGEAYDKIGEEEHLSEHTVKKIILKQRSLHDSEEAAGPDA